MRLQIKTALQRNCILKLDQNKSRDFERIFLSRLIYDAAKRDRLKFLKPLCNDAIELIKERHEEEK